MPTYDYKCPNCGTVLEMFHDMFIMQSYVCPKCNKVLIKQIGKGAGVIYKGDGFTKQRKE